VILTPTQSITIHGWFNPKRMLCWKDFSTNKNITTKLCNSCGVDDEMLYSIQPCLQAWIDTCEVSFQDVKYMTKWPLHPFTHLHGYIPDLVEHKYDAKLLLKLGINYQFLVSKSMTIEWMKMLNFSIKDWAYLGFDPTTMSDNNISTVFGMDRSTLQLMLTSYSKHQTR
jgi:hypothetical protein